LARELVKRGLRTLVVDCDPNPNLAESFGRDSSSLAWFGRDGLRRAGDTLELAREPQLVAVADRLWLLGGPPSDAPLADAIARGMAGVLIAERFDAVVTDLGAGPELAHSAVGGVLNPADMCLILSNGTPVASLTADRIADACRARNVPALHRTAAPGRAAGLATSLCEALLAATPGGPAR
jgi:hypothetical protein